MKYIPENYENDNADMFVRNIGSWKKERKLKKSSDSSELCLKDVITNQIFYAGYNAGYLRNVQKDWIQNRGYSDKTLKITSI